MTIDEFIAAAEEEKGSEAIDAFAERVKERTEKFEKEAMDRMVDEEFYARSYNL